MKEGKLDIDIDVERALAYYIDNESRIRRLAMWGEPGAMQVQDLVHIASSEHVDSYLVNMVLAIEEYRRSLEN